MSPLRKLAVALWAAVFVFGGILVGRYWGQSSAPPVVSPDREARPAVVTPTRLPPITLVDLREQTRSLTDWPNRTLLINFWATWCAPCREEMPLLDQLQQSMDPATLQVIGIALDRPEPVLRFVAETGISYPVLLGEEAANRAAEQFGEAFVGLPFSVLAAGDGTILSLHTGPVSARDLAQIGTVAQQLASGELTPAAARVILQRSQHGLPR